MAKDSAYNSFISRLREDLRTRGAEYWVRTGEKRALHNFHRAVESVPAYKKFLKKHGINPKSIRTIKDFSSVPETNKKNYILRYPLSERIPKSTLNTSAIIAASSGTTGEPTLWPRGVEQEEEAAAIHELLFTELYGIDRHKTLLIVGFPMGIYVSGIATALPSVMTAVRHPNLSVVTAGNNKESVLSAVSKLQNEYEQIILAGHPFFVKDVVETGKRQGIKWNKTKVRTFFVSEGFSETWRDYFSHLVKGTRPEDLLSFYGSTELLLMGYETPHTVRVRRYFSDHADKNLTMFGNVTTPNLFQYIPSVRFIEKNNENELLYTAWSGIPLIRYNMHDAGICIPYADIKRTLPKNISTDGWKLPYVALFGRSDHTLVFYAVNIYLEHVHTALNDKELLKKLTGKFKMEKVSRAKHEQHLVVHIELQKTARAESLLARRIEERITKTLLALNMEYADASARLGKDLRPRVVLHKNGDVTYFKAGLKPRYL